MVDPDIERTGKRERLCREGEAMNPRINGALREMRTLVSELASKRREYSQGDRGSAFLFAFSMSILIVKLMNRWQAGTFLTQVGPILQVPTEIFCTGALLSFWIVVTMRFFKRVGWPQWVAVPYVLMVLCPLGWIFTRRFGGGGDFLGIFGLQLPIVIAYTFRARK